MFEDDGIRTQNQMQGVDDEGNLKNVKVDANGYIITKAAPEEKVVEEAKPSSTLLCDIVILGAEGDFIKVGKKITKLEIANFSETSNVYVNVNSRDFTIAPNLVVDFSFDEIVEQINMYSDEEEVKVQYLVEGEE